MLLGASGKWPCRPDGAVRQSPGAQERKLGGGVTGRGELGFLGDGLQRVRPLKNQAVYWSELKPETVSPFLSLFSYQRNGITVPAY